jgi:ribosomal protein S18 acetylase RimI-like enzyme
MDFCIVNLEEADVDILEKKLDDYDKEYIKYRLQGNIDIGIRVGSDIIAGLSACMTSFKILYVSTVFVNKEYRHLGLGKILINEMEKRASALGANMVRLDTFNWQGRDFYISLGYEQVGEYSNDTDRFSEYFFLKRL